MDVESSKTANIHIGAKWKTMKRLLLFTVRCVGITAAVADGLNVCQFRRSGRHIEYESLPIR